MSALFQGYTDDQGFVNFQIESAAVRPPGTIDHRGMAVTPDGFILALIDTGQNRVFQNGIALERDTGMVLIGSLPAVTETPGGIVTDANGSIITADYVDVIHQGVGLTNEGYVSSLSSSCFRIVSAQIGDPKPDFVYVTFNEPFADPECLSGGWTFKTVERGDAGGAARNAVTPTTFAWQAWYGSENSSILPSETVRLDYSSGTGNCFKDGDPSPECELADYTDFPVTNNVYGPSQARIGDLDDITVSLYFDVNAATAGDGWSVEVDTFNNPITNIAIDNGVIRLTLTTAVNPGETVTVSHIFDTTRGTAVDGREIYQFYDLPVQNVIGVSFWKKEDLGNWLLDGDTGQWELDGG